MIKKIKMKKEIILEAIQFDGNNEKECKIFLEDNYDLKDDFLAVSIVDKDEIAFQPVFKSEWIVKGYTGHFFIKKNKEFKKEYEIIK